MLSSARPKTPYPAPLDGRVVVVLALWLSFPVIGLDQFLRTSPGQISRQPTTAIGHWVADSMIALPLFAIGVLAADWIARRLRLGLDHRADVLKRALLVTAMCALALAPGWFQVDRTDNPVTAQPLVFPQAHDSGDVYWVASGVIITLASACLIPLAAWAGLRLSRPRATRSRATRSPVRAAAIARAALIVALVAAMPVLAWLLHQAAVRAYASRVYETSSALAVRPRPHQVQSIPSPMPTSGQLPATAATTAATAPFAIGYQAAHALQDGLAGQAAGLPVALAVLAWGAGAAGTSRSRRAASPRPAISHLGTQKESS
jgi:hypothetical protein